MLKRVIHEAAGERKPEAYQFSPTRRELPGSSFPEGYAVDCDEPRMNLGNSASWRAGGVVRN